MFKKIAFIFAFSIFSVSPALAFDSSQLHDNLAYQELKAYNKDFDILVMDFTVTGLENDDLNTLTVYNDRTANGSDDILALKLWLDDGDNIWQGYLVDQLVATAVKLDSRRWVFSDLNTPVSTNNNHFYISVETKNIVTDQHRLQLEIDQLYDANSNHIYDQGDKGIFFNSQDNGPSEQRFLSSYVYTFEQRGGDSLAPKIAITNLKNNQILSFTSSTNVLTLTGGAKDRMGGQVNAVKISIVPKNQVSVWQDVNALTIDFATWDHVVNDLVAGEYDMQIQASDGDNNIIITDILTFNVNILNNDQGNDGSDDQQNDDAQDNDLPVWTGGRLLKIQNSSSVYWLLDNKIYWFFNAKIFFQYFMDFSQIETISLEELATYELAGSVPIKPGTLMQSVDSNQVYEVNAHWQRRWLQSATEAQSLYGADWGNKIQSVSGAYLSLYQEVENL